MRFDIKDLDKLVVLLKKHYEDDNPIAPFSERKVRFMLEQEWNNPKTYIAVNEQMTAVLIFKIVPVVFSTAQQIQEVCFYSESAGSGFRLLKEAQKWVNNWGMDKIFVSTGNDKVNKMLERFGMKQVGS